MNERSSCVSRAFDQRVQRPGHRTVQPTPAELELRAVCEHLDVRGARGREEAARRGRAEDFMCDMVVLLMRYLQFAQCCKKNGL